jgi:hypothetical protein
MKRITVKRPDEIDTRLRREASRRGTRIAEVTREAIAAKAGRSGRRDTASNIEEIIRREARRSR